jgi:hypothetical protein
MYRQRCPYPTFGSGDTCRWHRFAADLREFIALIPKGGPQAAMSSVVGQGVVGLFALWHFVTQGGAFWAFAAFLAAGSGLKFFSEAMICLRYPLSDLPLWPRAVVLASVVELVSGALLALAFATSGASVAAGLLSVLGSPGWTTVVAVVVIGYAVLMTGNAVTMLERASFRVSKLIHGIASTGKLALFWAAMYGVVPRLIPSLDPRHWSPFSHVPTPKGALLPLAMVVTFLADEVLNVAVRKRRLDADQFAATVAASYPACLVPALALPWLAFAAGERLGLQNRYVLLASGIVLGVACCYLATRYLVYATLRAAYEEQGFERRFSMAERRGE